MAMTRKERLQAVMEMREPDMMPILPRICQGLLVYSMGWRLLDITSATHVDAEKSAQAVLTSLDRFDYDIAFGTYMDAGLWVGALGGTINIPDEIGTTVNVDIAPVENKLDWPQVKKKLPVDPWKHARMKEALESIRLVAQAVGEHTPICAGHFAGISSASMLFRKPEALSADVVEDPEFVDEMCEAATEFSMDWIRAQYDAGANSLCHICDYFGLDILSPKMAERFSLPYIAKIVDVVRKEFGQKTIVHIHGNMKTPKGYALLEKIVKEAGAGGIHLDEKHDPRWIKENVIERLGVPAGIIMDGLAPLASGPVEKIEAVTKEMIHNLGNVKGVFMAPSCQVPPHTPSENFKAWVDATHKYGQYPIAVD